MAEIGNGTGFPVAPPADNVIAQRSAHRIETPNATIVATEDGRIEIHRKAPPSVPIVEQTEPVLSAKTLAEMAEGRRALEALQGRTRAQAPALPADAPPKEKPAEKVHRPGDHIPDPKTSKVLKATVLKE